MTESNIPIVATRPDGYRIVANVHDLPAGTPCWPVMYAHCREGGGFVSDSTGPVLWPGIPNPCPVLIAPAAPRTEYVNWWEAAGRTLVSTREHITSVSMSVGAEITTSRGNSYPLADGQTVAVLVDTPSDDDVWVLLPRKLAGTIAPMWTPDDCQAMEERMAEALARNPEPTR